MLLDGSVNTNIHITKNNIELTPLQETNLNSLPIFKKSIDDHSDSLTKILGMLKEILSRLKALEDEKKQDAITKVIDLNTDNLFIVFGSSGMRGSAEMGAWKAIRELGLEEHVKGAVGSSIGSIMSAMFVAGEYEKSMTLWNNITEEQVFPDPTSQRTLEQDNAIIAQMYKYNSSIKDIAIVVDSLVNGTRSNEGYRNIINENVNLDKIMASDKELIITTIDITKLKLLKANREEMTRDLIPVYILASGACVPVLPAVTINGDTCIDSGYIDPVPIDVARQYGATKIIAIDINTNASLSDEEAAARDLIYIHPNVQGSFLDFDQETVQANITEGYNAVINAFKNVTIIPKTTATN